MAFNPDTFFKANDSAKGKSSFDPDAFFSQDISGKRDKASQISGHMESPSSTTGDNSSFKDKAIGVGEAALSTVTNLTGGAFGLAVGAAQGVLDSVIKGDFGTPEAQHRVEEKASQSAEALTYSPKTEKGKEYTEEAGKLLQQAMPLAPLGHELGAVSGGLEHGIRSVSEKATSLAKEESQTHNPLTPLASTDKEGNIHIDEEAATRDFHNNFSYIFDGEGPTGAQKKAVFEKLGINREQFTEMVRTPEQYQVFLKAHEESHVANGDHAAYPRNAKGKPDLMHPDSLEIETRATQDAIKELDSKKLDMGVPNSDKELEDTLYSLGKNNEADKVEGAQLLQAAEKDGVTPEMKLRWRDFAEGTTKEMDPQEAILFNKYMKPVLDERADLIKTAQEKGWTPPVEMSAELAGENIGRKMVPKSLTPFEKLKQSLTESDQGGLNLNIEKKPGGAKERGIFVAEFPNGRRVVIQAGDTGVFQWNKGKPTKFAEKDTPVRSGETIGSATIKEARTPEIEANTPYRYNQDTLAVNLERVSELRDFVRSKQLIENIKQSDRFKEISHKVDSKTEIPPGFVIPKHIDKLPEFAGLAFDKETATIIEDFARHYQPNALTLVSGALIKNMMLNPIPHMINEGWHLYNARGLTGWVTPAGITRFIRTGVPALKEVMTQGPQYRSMLRDGASLLSTTVRSDPVAKGFMDKGMEEFVKSEEGTSLDQKLAMKPLDLYNAISSKSSQAMWVVRDAMYMQLINEKRLKGMTQTDAIQEVERHMPNYRIPTNVLGSRKLSEALQNPNVTVFSRYHYGMLKSLGETAKDLSGKRGVEAFKEGVDTAVAISVAIAVLYPLQDMLAHMLTGNNDATVRRAGPYHPIVAIHEILQGEKDPQALLASMFTFNPALLMGAQLIADRKLYNGQAVYQPTDNPKLIAKDVGNYLVNSVPQFSTVSKVSDDKRGGGVKQWLAKQLDIDSPTKEDVKAKERIKRMKAVASRNKLAKQKAKDNQ